jgi:hypothetical protein
VAAGEDVLTWGKVMWDYTMVATVTPTNILRIRKSSIDGYKKDRKALEMHQALRCFR